MNKKSILIGLGIATLIICFIWWLTDNSRWEILAVAISAIVIIIGASTRKSESNTNDVIQSNTVSSFNDQKVKNKKGKIRQFNFFSFKNTQEIENESEPK